MTDAKKQRRDTAVALHYDGQGAPRIVAKGHGHIAQQMTSIAAEHRVPMRRDDDLASVLAAVPLGDEIPRELYVAVAQVLLFAYEITGKTLPDRE